MNGPLTFQCILTAKLKDKTMIMILAFLPDHTKILYAMQLLLSVIIWDQRCILVCFIWDFSVIFS